jgi:hypothetical protein
MTDHGLEVGVIANLDIDGGGGARGLESDRIVCAEVGKEIALVPRCLPLGLHRQQTWSTNPKGEAKNATYHIPDAL